MRGKTQCIGAALLICGLLLSGCNLLGPGKQAKVHKELATTPAEQKKAKLHKKIDRKFEDPELHYELGELYQAERRWAEAESEYKMTLNYDPAHRDAQAGRVKMLINLGDTPKAEVLADEYMQRVSHSAVGSLQLALAFQEQELDEYALYCYRQSLRLAPNSAKINRQIGYYYLSKNDKVRAEGYLRRSFQLDPLQPNVAGELGRLGIKIEVPRKTVKKTKKLDRIVEKSGKKE